MKKKAFIIRFISAVLFIAFSFVSDAFANEFMIKKEVTTKKISRLYFNENDYCLKNKKTSLIENGSISLNVGNGSKETVKINATIKTYLDCDDESNAVFDIVTTTKETYVNSDDYFSFIPPSYKRFTKGITIMLDEEQESDRSYDKKNHQITINSPSLSAYIIVGNCVWNSKRLEQNKKWKNIYEVEKAMFKSNGKYYSANAMFVKCFYLYCFDKNYLYSIAPEAYNFIASGD